jgi:hypothetical protein
MPLFTRLIYHDYGTQSRSAGRDCSEMEDLGRLERSIPALAGSVPGPAETTMLATVATRHKGSGRPSSIRSSRLAGGPVSMLVNIPNRKIGQPCERLICAVKQLL